MLKGYSFDWYFDTIISKAFFLLAKNRTFWKFPFFCWKEFIRTVLYKGNSDETYLQTRVRSYDKQSTKSKTTMTIPPDIDSCTQHILQCQLTSFNWINSDKNTIPSIILVSHDWISSDNCELFPLWFFGSQLFL